MMRYLVCLVALAILACAACGPDNMPPEVVKAIPEQRISVSDTARVTAADHFADPEGGSLAYAASSSASGVVTATMDGGEIVLVALDAGEAEITVTATDSVEAATEQTFAAHALNDPPMAVEALPDLALVVGGHATADLDSYFSDPNGDALTYSAASSNPAAGVVVEGSILTVVAQSVGAAQVEVLATDPDGEFATSAFSVSVRDADREVLEILYDELDGDNWDDNTNWKTERPLDEWYGVGTNAAGRVDTLNLRSNLLKGEIPPGLGSLSGLVFLSFYSNSLTGEIPPELGELSNLDWLDLGENDLAGELPPELGELSNLRDLYLEYNELTGEVPSSFLGLTLTKFYWQGWGRDDSLCAPSTAEFDEWLDGIDDTRGPRCD